MPFSPEQHNEHVKNRYRTDPVFREKRMKTIANIQKRNAMELKQLRKVVSIIKERDPGLIMSVLAGIECSEESN